MMKSIQPKTLNDQTKAAAKNQKNSIILKLVGNLDNSLYLETHFEQVVFVIQDINRIKTFISVRSGTKSVKLEGLQKNIHVQQIFMFGSNRDAKKRNPVCKKG